VLAALVPDLGAVADVHVIPEHPPATAAAAAAAAAAAGQGGGVGTDSARPVEPVT
jgi:hypothetical protein